MSKSYYTGEQLNAAHPIKPSRKLNDIDKDLIIAIAIVQNLLGLVILIQWVLS